MSSIMMSLTLKSFLSSYLFFDNSNSIINNQIYGIFVVFHVLPHLSEFFQPSGNFRHKALHTCCAATFLRNAHLNKDIH